MTTEYTPNFRLSLPDFRMGPWHDLVNDDFVLIDSLIMGLYQGVDTQPWDNNVHFKSGDTAVDQTDGTFWVCVTEHTSAPTGTFAADRAAHPTYWNRVVVGIAPRGAWTHNTHYLPNDMVSDAVQHVIAVCKTEHTSNASGTIRDDAAYWTFIADMGTTAINALQVAYDNTASGTTKTDLQGTTDELYSRLAAQVAQIAANTGNIATNSTNISNNTTSIGNLTTRVTNTETVNTSQDATIATKIGDAPNDGNQYARKNLAWSIVAGGGGGSTVYVQDTPPAGAAAGSLWWESDTGLLFVRYNDGDSTQWVLAMPIPDPSAFVSKGGDTMTGALVLPGNPSSALQAAPKQYVDGVAVRYDAVQALTATQKSQARANIDVMKKNYIVNSFMVISQEWSNTALVTSNFFPVDQWQVEYATSGTLSYVQAIGATPGGSPNRLRVTVTAVDTSITGTDHAQIIQQIEGIRVADLKFGTASAKAITLQFGVKAPAGIYSISFMNTASNRSYVAEYVIAAGEANTDVIKSVTIPGDVTGTWATDSSLGLGIHFALMCGPTYAQAAGSWGANNVVGSPNQFNLLGTNGNVFELFDVGLYEGTVAPAYQLPDYTTEMVLCQRYFWRWAAPSAALRFALAYCDTTINAQAVINVPVPMRTTPTMAQSGLSLNGIAVTTASISWFNMTVCHVAFNVASGLTSGTMTQVYSAAGGGAFQLNARM